MGKFYQCIQSYGPSFMTKFCSALLYLENLLTNIFAKLNLCGGVSCMPAALLFDKAMGSEFCPDWYRKSITHTRLIGSSGTTLTILHQHFTVDIDEKVIEFQCWNVFR